MSAFDYLRDLPDGALSRAEVRILLDEIDRLRAALEEIRDLTFTGHTGAVEAARRALSNPYYAGRSAE